MTTTMKPGEEKEHVRFDPFDGAYIVERGSRRIETYGNDHPVLAIRGLGRDKNGGCSLRFAERDEAWSALSRAVAGEGEAVQATLGGYLRDGNEVERHADLLVTVGRTTAGRILVSMLPLSEKAKLVQVQMSRETAYMFAKAMQTNDHRARKALVVDALRHDLEISNELTR